MQALVDSLRKALLLSAALLLAPAFATAPRAPTADAATTSASATAGKKVGKPVAKPADGAKAPVAKAGPSRAGSAKAAPRGPAKSAVARSAGKADRKAVAKKEPENLKPGPLADFGSADAPAEVVHLANWVSWSRNAKKKAFVLIDKKLARLYVFDPQGKLKSNTPILLGKAIGDHTVPGIGTRPMAQIKEDEKTTPAGRFLAQPGKNTHGEDIIWVDYNAAVSMHRMRKVADEERRAERMASPEVSDNRISYGCVNVPHAFYNKVLKPTVMKHGAYVYVLPETTTPQQLFGSVDVPAAQKKTDVAEASGKAAAK